VARETRFEEHPVVQGLLEAPQEYNFFQAVAMVENIAGRRGRVGHQNAATENLRFGADPNLGMPLGGVASAELDPETRKLMVRTPLLGLYGPTSPLPCFFTEEIMWAEEDEKGAQAFLDIFHHRAISFLYRAAWKYRLGHSFRENEPNDLVNCALALVGLLTPGLLEQTKLGSHRMLRYAGLLLQRPRSARGLAGLLSDYFHVPVDVEEGVDRWVLIPEDQRACLGRGCCTLGEDASIGSQVKDVSSKIGVALGPMGFAEYMEFLPGGARFPELDRLTTLYLEDPIEFSVELRLEPRDLPELRLGQDLPLLGFTTWLPGETETVQTVTFDPSRYAA